MSDYAYVYQGYDRSPDEEDVAYEYARQRAHRNARMRSAAPEMYALLERYYNSMLDRPDVLRELDGAWATLRARINGEVE